MVVAAPVPEPYVLVPLITVTPAPFLVRLNAPVMLPERVSKKLAPALTLLLAVIGKLCANEPLAEVAEIVPPFRVMLSGTFARVTFVLVSSVPVEFTVIDRPAVVPRTELVPILNAPLLMMTLPLKLNDWLF